MVNASLGDQPHVEVLAVIQELLAVMECAVTREIFVVEKESLE